MEPLRHPADHVEFTFVPIVKRAIEAHGGSISVTSLPGRETKFLITVPAGQAAELPT